MRTWAKIVLPLLVLALGGAIANVLIKTRPEANRKAPGERPTLVDVRAIKAAEKTLRIPAHGTIIPAQLITLKSEVNGRVIEISPRLIPGGRFKAGDVIARLDDRDLQMTVADRQSQLARTQLDLAMEKGRQDIARREWALINNGATKIKNNDLALRIPHIRSADAAVTAATRSLERARRDVERAVVRAPFNAVIKDESIDLGQLVNNQMTIATLVGTDTFLIQLSVPLEALDSIQLPDGEGRRGSKVEVFATNSEKGRAGKVIRVLGDLDPIGRMARLLVAIDNPLDAQGDKGRSLPPLFLGDYVRVEIIGQRYPAAFEIPRLALHNRNEIWLASEDRLEIRTIQPVWRGTKTIILTEGLKDGELIITSPIATPIAGMKLRRSDQVKKEAPAKNNGAPETQEERS